MNKLKQNNSWSIRTIEEILGDMLCFDLILEIKRHCKNIETKCYLSHFLKILAPVYCYEVIHALDDMGVIAKKQQFEKEFLDFINEQRQNTLKRVITTSRQVKKVIKEMGINFDRITYDMNVVVKADQLLDMSFEDNIDTITHEDLWEIMFALPERLVKVILSGMTGEKIDFDIYNKVEDKILLASQIADHHLGGKRYSYATCRLFKKNTTLTETDKIFILYRFRLITSIQTISKLVPNLNLSSNSKTYYDINYFFRKYKALVVAIIGAELKELNSSFATKIQEDIDGEVNKSFFRLNRKLRNNLHYTETDVLTEDEMNCVDRNQNIYFKILRKHITSCFSLDIDAECKFMTRFSEAYRNSGITSEDFNQNYYYYYEMFRKTGKLIK